MLLKCEGEVVARFSGRGEFGSRALGNRSILADPRSPETVRTINEMIKQRDCWMPFAASILDERATDYVINPKSLDASYMTLAFDSTPLSKSEMPCGLHPYDYTCRPHVVTKHSNPDYHNLLTAFDQQTGIGGLLTENPSWQVQKMQLARSPALVLNMF